jgi:hypothetical protein
LWYYNHVNQRTWFDAPFSQRVSGGKQHLRGECDLKGEIALAHQGMLFLGEIREISGIM